MTTDHLRQLHLASLGGGGQPMAPAMGLALQASFGSVERWRAGVLVLVEALGPWPGDGDGWLVLAFSPGDGRLVNQVVRPDAPRVDGVPILVLRLHEGRLPQQALTTDLDDVDWSAVYQRYQRAVQAASEGLAASQDDVAQALVLDVRRKGAFEVADDVIPGSRWRDPMSVAEWAQEWAPELSGPEPPGERRVIVYCVFGHEVGRATALRLRAAGVDARFLQGGIEGWREAGRPLEAKLGRRPDGGDAP